MFWLSMTHWIALLQSIHEKVAEALGIAPITVKREWAKAKAWLYDQLQSGNGG